MRKPNTVCTVCNEPIYRRPNQLLKQKSFFCSETCQKSVQIPVINCQVCLKEFKAPHWNSKCCSKSCANALRKGTTYSKHGVRNFSRARLDILKEVFKFESCMVKGCEYSNTFDVHRLIPAKGGGRYELGNMFAICPNHHAEVTRGLIVLNKISDCELVIGT